MRNEYTIGASLLLAAYGGASDAHSSMAPVAHARPAPVLPATTAPPRAPNRGSINVAFIGGSITEGAFASTPNLNYAALVTKWLGTRYEHVNARNLGVGGTGSEFGAYRVDQDLAGFVPDLVFLEFTVNDAGESRERIFADLDAIIFKARQMNPRVRIVYLSTTDAREEPLRRAGGRASFVEPPAAAMAFERLPFIDLGVGLWAKVIAGAPITTYLVDGVHPTDAGHQLYADEIRQDLEATIPLANRPSIPGSPLIAQSKLGTARLVSARSATGCRPATLDIKYMTSAVQCGQGDSFTFRFRGTTLGMVRAVVRDGGRLACTIDRQKPATMDFFDAGGLIYSRPAGTILYRGLTPGAHLLACTVNGDVISATGGNSTGHKVTIGAFMISDARPVTLR